MMMVIKSDVYHEPTHGKYITGLRISQLLLPVLHDACGGHPVAMSEPRSRVANATSMSESDEEHYWSDEEIHTIRSALASWAALGVEKPDVKDIIELCVVLLTSGKFRTEHGFSLKGNRARVNLRGYARHLLRCRASAPGLPTAVFVEIWRYAYGRAMKKMPEEAASARNDADSRYEGALSVFFAKSNHNNTAAALDREIEAIMSGTEKLKAPGNTRKPRHAPKQDRSTEPEVRQIYPCDRDDMKTQMTGHGTPLAHDFLARRPYSLPPSVTGGP